MTLREFQALINDTVRRVEEAGLDPAVVPVIGLDMSGEACDERIHVEERFTLTDPDEHFEDFLWGPAPCVGIQVEH